MPDRQYLIALSTVPGIGPARMRKLLAAFGTPEAAWRAPRPSLVAAGLEERIATALVARRQELDPATVTATLERLGARALTPGDDEYPARLAELAGMPLVLYVRGALTAADARAVALVGTRAATSHGREMARRLAAELAAAGITIVSGLARGIDAAAHEAALEAGGRTIAVLGCGVDIIYPAAHRGLAERIMASGALVAEYPPGTPPDGPNFPARNRIISGLSLGVVVVEAPSRSGALITATFAGEQGREVCAVPGSVLSPASAGCHALIRDGATLVTSGAEVLEALNLDRREAQAAARQLPLGDNPTERRLLELLSSEPVHIDELARTSGLSILDLNSTLMMMELKGMVRQTATLNYILA